MRLQGVPHCRYTWPRGQLSAEERGRGKDSLSGSIKMTRTVVLGPGVPPLAAGIPSHIRTVTAFSSHCEQKVCFYFHERLF